ncbi:O-methylsterigmatocystin oxidoreductase [Favolaschia claudopus]|uniref:O-methylsterigmatocystin oxidoreductase n=1 Tax=Favolaschia claudopus TaxID=2862362 RepID=A0AAW0DBZ7_9AGAR
MFQVSSLVELFLAAVFLKIFHKFFYAWKHVLPFPPGPPPRFLVGNSRDLPQKQPWLTYTEWGRRYGELVHASALGHHIVIVNSVKTANELFEKRSHVYSDRPVITMIELMGWGFNVGLMPMSDRWRQHRRMFQQHFRRDIARTYRPIQTEKIHQLLQQLLSDPQNFREHLKTLTAAIIMRTVYGYDVKPNNDRFVDLSERAVKKLSDSFFPGAAVVNAFPILRYLPSWFPGAGFQAYAADCRLMIEEMQQVPFNFAKQNMLNGVDAKPVVAKMLQVRGRTDEVAIREAAATAYAAGSDTTVSALASFFLAMAQYPAVQERAQKEIDSVIGSARLPQFEDRPSLPFVEALYREVMRWRPALPLGVSHATSTEDIYNGFYIPKGATVMANAWAMTRDETVYPDPERFNPDRFFTADGKLNDDDTILTFGFGRRICVGRHNAEATVWFTIVSVLATFKISKAKDAAGNEIEINAVYSDGMVSHPRPFPCSITPRSVAAQGLVISAVEDL